LQQLIKKIQLPNLFKKTFLKIPASLPTFNFFKKSNGFERIIIKISLEGAKVKVRPSKFIQK